jgi:hypothetical protein
MLYDDMFNELKAAFEGKRISKVERSNAPESIAKFQFSDGTGLTLFATELGYWLKPLPSKEGYSSLSALFEDFHDTLYYDKTYPKIPTLKVQGDKLVLTYEDKTLIGNIKAMHKAEKRIINHPEGLDLLAGWAELGACWTAGFYYPGNKMKPDCPEELVISDEEIEEMRNGK